MTYTSLFDPYTIGDLNLKNRIAMAPMTRGRAGDSRVPNELMAEHYYQRSSAGLLITEATVISLSLIHISEPTRPSKSSRMPSSA